MLTFNQLLASSGIAAATELTVASLANPTELNAVGTAVPDWRLCHTTTAGSDQATLYRLDASSDAANAPYIMASATAGLMWVAISGRYAYVPPSSPPTSLGLVPQPFAAMCRGQTAYQF